MIINDANECLVPVFELTLQEVYGTVVTVKQKTSTILKFVINCSYFNPLPSKWEPIIEKFGLEMDIIQENNPKLSILLTIDEDFDILNINISEEMILTLHSTFMTWKNDYEKKILKKSQTGIPRVSIFGYNNLEDHPEENELIDYISPYIIENQTGFPIEIETDHSLLNEDDRTKSKSKLLRSRSKKIQDLVNKTYKLTDKQKTQYLVKSSIEDMFKQSLKETATPKNFVKVKIHHDKCNISPVTGIDIDRSYPTNYSLEVKTESGEDFFEKGFKLVYNVKIQNHTKIITFSSPFKIYNTTQTPYSIKLLNNSHVSEALLEPRQSFAVPLGFIDGQLDIKVQGAQDAFSFSMSFREFMDKPIQLFESQIGTHVVSLKSRKKDAETDFYEIFIQSPFMIKNCCGTELLYRISQSADLDSDLMRLQPQEINYESSISTGQQLFLQVRIPGFFWSQKILVYSPNPKTHAQNEITLTDISGNSLSLHIFTPHEQFTTKKFLIYTKTCIINQTPYHLSYLLPGKQELVSIPGQTPTDADLDFNPHVTLTNEINRFVIAHDKDQKSNVINVESAEAVYVELWQKDKPSLELGLDISFMECDRDYKLYTQIIHINPRYVIVSKIDQEIQIKGETDHVLTLKKDERQSFQGNHKKQILMRFKDNDDWSKEIDISSPNMTNFKISNANKYVKATVTFQGSVLFVVFEEEKRETSELKIQNDIPDIQIKVSQMDSSEAEIIKPGNTIPWGWELPSGKKQVFVEFVTEQGSEFKTDQFFDFSTFNQTQKVAIPGNAPSELKHIFAVVTMEGHSKTLKFFSKNSSGRQGLQSPARSITEESLNQTPQKLITFNFEVNISGIGVSLISRQNNSETLKKERREVLYLFLAGVQFKMLSSTENTIHQLRVKYLNLDNNTHFKTTFPVLLTPTKPKDLLLGDNSYMVDLLVSQKTNVEAPYFETIQFLLAETTLRADGMVLDAVMQTMNNLSSAFRFNEVVDIQTITTAECLYSSTEDAKVFIWIDLILIHNLFRR